MTQIKEIIEKEHQRTTDIVQLRKIMLFREGSFLRAYEWSAWLCRKFCGELKVTKRQIKGIEQPVVYVGFPLTSIEKFTPKAAQVIPQSDGSIEINISTESIAENADTQMLVCEYEKWRQELPMTDGNGQKSTASATVSEHSVDSNFQNMAVSQHSSVALLIHRIVSYPIEMRTPVDNIQFISELKQMASVLV